MEEEDKARRSLGRASDQPASVAITRLIPVITRPQTRRPGVLVATSAPTQPVCRPLLHIYIFFLSLCQGLPYMEEMFEFNCNFLLLLPLYCLQCCLWMTNDADSELTLSERSHIMARYLGGLQNLRNCWERECEEKKRARDGGEGLSETRNSTRWPHAKRWYNVRYALLKTWYCSDNSHVKPLA